MTSKRAAVLIRPEPHYRADAFTSGLQRLGYKVSADVARCDVLVTWNRNSSKDRFAQAVLKRGGRVLVAENAYLGNGFTNERAYSLSEGEHSGPGKWPFLDKLRWHTFGYPLLDPKTEGDGSVLLLVQRGIGSPVTAQPFGYATKMEGALSKHYKVRVRKHPGKSETHPLEDALRGCSAVATWASGAAVRAVAMGYPCYYGLHKWVLADCSCPLWDIKKPFVLDAHKRQVAFERLAWCQWRLSELASGFAFDTLLRTQ